MTDAHIHIARCDGKEIKEPHIGEIKKSLEAYRRAGVIAVRDGGDKAMLGALARSVASDFDIVFKTPICAVYRRGGYGSFLGIPAGSKKEIDDALSKIFAQKPDFIKVIASGLVDFNSFASVGEGGFDAPELRYICNLAHDRGLRVMAHCNGRKAVGSAIETGADSIEHGYFIGRDELFAMRERSIVWTPTFAPLSNLLRGGSPCPERRAVIEKTLALHGENLRFAAKIGVLTAIGSDAGSPFVGHGSGSSDELSCFVRAGLDRELALSMAQEAAAALDLCNRPG